MATPKDYRSIFDQVGFDVQTAKKLLDMQPNAIDNIIMVMDPVMFTDKNIKSPKPGGGSFKDLKKKLYLEASNEVKEYNDIMIKIATLEDELTSKSANLQKLSKNTKSEEYSKTVKSIQATSISLTQLTERAKNLKKTIQVQDKAQWKSKDYIQKLEQKLKSLCK